MSNFSFDGIRKNYCDYMDYTSGWGQTRELEITDVKGRPGGVLNNIAEKVREIEATILVDATYNTRTLEELADDFVGWLTTDEPKPSSKEVISGTWRLSAGFSGRYFQSQRYYFLCGFFPAVYWYYI